VVALLGVLVVGLLRSHAEILRALHDLGVNLEDGAPPAATARAARAAATPLERGELGRAIDLGGQLPSGGAAHVAVVGVEHDTLLAFLTTGCGTCATFWEALGDPAARQLPGGDTRIVIVTQDSSTESPAKVADLAPHDVVTVMSSEAWDAYGVPVAPFFALVDGRTGQVRGEGSGQSWPQVVELLGRSIADQDLPDAEPAARRRGHRANGAERAEAVDEALRAAGIAPGDASLYPAPAEDEPV
jgi:hypothetical protein